MNDNKSSLCSLCFGTGIVEIWLNNKREIDYERGRPTGQVEVCECQIMKKATNVE